MTASSSIISGSAGGITLHTQHLSKEGLTLLATLPSGLIVNSVDTLTLFKVDSSLLNQDGNV